jgi:hypothetical protein
LAGVFSVWLAICLAEPAQLHTCVMHGALAISVQGGGSHHGASHAAAGHSHNQSNDDGRGQQCTCLGDCSAGNSPIGLAASSNSFASVSVETAAALFSYASPSIVAPHFLLPFSNGPPDASSRA